MKVTINIHLLIYLAYFLFLWCGGMDALSALNKANEIYFNVVLGCFLFCLIVYGCLFLYGMAGKYESIIIKTGIIILLELMIGIPTLVSAQYVKADVTPDNYKSLFFIGFSTILINITNSLTLFIARQKIDE